MIKQKLIVPVLILFSYFSFAQEKDVELSTVKNDDGITISAINNSSVQQEITLTLKMENLRASRRPVKKLIPANSTVEMITLFYVKNKKYSYSTSYTYKRSLSASETVAYNENMEAKTAKEIGDVNEGLIVFYKEGCPRSQYTVSTLLDNDVDFRIIDITNNDENNNRLWEIVKKEDPKLKTYTFPVIINNGKVSYSIKDLKGFVGTLEN